jgi:uncharacterized SAM-binding protein YcdF (DUF218 family)
MVELLKANMRPSSISCLLLLLTPGVALLYIKPLAAWGRRWVTAVAAVYWVLSMPFTVGLLTRTLMGGYAPIAAAPGTERPQAVVMLGSGTLNLRSAGQQLSIVTPSSGLRILETARVAKTMNPPLVIASGGVTERDPAAAPESHAYHAALLALGVPADRIVLESASKNTHDEALIVKEILGARKVDRFLLVTSPLHMRRSMRTFKSQGLHPIAAVAPLYPETTETPPPVLPSDATLAIGDAILYEWAATAYYWWKGWL